MKRIRLTEREYEKRVNLIEDLVEFHPEYLERVPVADREILHEFYFAGREIDLRSIHDHRLRLRSENPKIEDRAEQAWQRFREVARIR